MATEQAPKVEPTDTGFAFEKPQGWMDAQANVFHFAEPGDNLQGLYTGKAVSGQFDSIVYTIVNPDDNETIAVFGSAVLDNRMKHVPVGSQVFIGYKGTVKTKSGQSAKDFAVYYNAAKIDPQYQAKVDADLPF